MITLNPYRWFFPLPPPLPPEPTALDVAIKQLQEAECDRLLASADREHHASRETMYRGRCVRLRQDISEMMCDREVTQPDELHMILKEAGA